MRRFVSVVVASVVAALLAPLGPLVSPASAAPAAPTLTAPAANQQVSENPVLRWSAVPRAVKYEVQVSTSQSFPTPVAYSVTTANTIATPPNDLPLGTYYWRVRGVDSGNAAGPYSTSTFDKLSRPSPVPVSPTNGADLVYPQNSLFFSWQPLPGSKTYEIQIDDDPQFVGAPDPVSTPNTRYAPLTPPVFGTDFWWRVRGKSGSNVYSDWSVPQSYRMAWSPTPVTLMSPPSSNDPSVEEVVLDWQPMAGASYYEIQVSPDANFNAPVVRGADNTRGRKVVGTRFADNDIETGGALSLAPGAYYWRVRAMSTSATAEPGPWSVTWTFTRAWPGTNTLAYARPNGTSGTPGPNAQVALLKPDNGDFSLAEPQFSWSPQRGASHYEVQFSSDDGFSPDRVGSCFTDHTTLTPFWRVVPNSQTTCQPVNRLGEDLIRPGAVTYWRVRALDASGPYTTASNGGFTPGRSFLYDPANITQLTPADGATVATPVLSWTPVENIALYKVTLDGVGDYKCNDLVAYTYSTTYVPETLNPACGGYWQWTVQGVEDDNDSSYNDGAQTRLPLGGWRTFYWAPPTGTAVGPDPVTTTPLAAHQPPLMSWPAVAGATRYQVWASLKGANSYSLMHDGSQSTGGTNQTSFAFPGNGSSMTRLLSPGDYDFHVRAFDATGLIGQSDTYTFHIDPLKGPVLNTPAHCPLGSCTTVEYDTPTFSWDPVEGAGLYLLYLARDPNFQNITHEFRTAFTTFTPAESLPDSQAGQATYWLVRPCYMPSACGPFDETVFPQARAFRKVSVPVQTELPQDGYVERTGEVTFSWKDYLLANQAKGVSQEAAYYRVQVSNTENFTTVLETSPRVDATEYTADLKTYPDGPLYWKVQAYDQTNNPLTFSAPIAFRKSLAGPTGLVPDGYAKDSSAPLLTWPAMAYSSQYEVEVYRSTDPNAALSPVNRVAGIKTRLPSAIPLTTLAAGTYAWRVRRIDINNNPGQWSSDASATPSLDKALAHFEVAASGPTLRAPLNGAKQDSNTLLFEWDKVSGATRYRIEVSTTSSFGTLIDSETTDMTSWAPDLLTPVLPNTTIYWRVRALDPAGGIVTTSATWSFQRDASTSGEFTAVSPYRVLDTRKTGGPLAQYPRTVTLTGGSTGIPGSGVSAVVLNATATGPTKSSYVTLYPAGTTKPTVSSLNFVAGQTVANHVTVPVDSMGRISMANAAGSVHMLFDVVGYYSNGKLERGTRFTPANSPTRIVDTRGPRRPLYSGENRVMEVAGLGGVPGDARSVVMNVTAVNPTKAGWLTVYPTSTTKPTASSLNFPAGRTVPNLVTMPLGPDGKVVVYNSAGTTDVLLDVIGWYQSGDPAPGARMNAVAPTRIADTRQAAFAPKLANGATRSFQVRGRGGIPDTGNVTGAVVNVTIVAPAGSGWATVFPSGTTRPTASNLNYVAGQTVANQVLARVGSDGKVNVYTSSSAHVIIDVVGWLGS